MYIDKDHDVVHYESLTELLDDAHDSTFFRQAETKDFAPRDGQSTEDLARRGCNEAAARAAALVEEFSDEIAAYSWADEPTVAGCYPVVAEFLSGDPECMRLPTLRASEAEPLTLVVDLTSRWDIQPHTLERRGAAVMALVQSLSAQRPVTLKIGFLCRNPKQSGRRQTAGVLVDIETSPLDLATTAFAMSDASFIRRLIYGAADKYSLYDNMFPSYLKDFGADATNPGYVSRCIEALGLTGEVLYLPPLIQKAQEVTNNPVSWLKKQLERYGQRQLELA